MTQIVPIAERMDTFAQVSVSQPRPLHINGWLTGLCGLLQVLQALYARDDEDSGVISEDAFDEVRPWAGS